MVEDDPYIKTGASGCTFSILEVPSSSVTSVVISRKDGKIYYNINGAGETYLNDITYNPIFNISTWFGASPTDAAGSGARRYFTGTLSNLYIIVVK